MPQKAKDIGLPKHLKILAYGEFAAGKTIFATTFPKPILFFDFDDGRETYGGMADIDYELYVEDPTTRRATAYRRFVKDLDNYARDNAGYKTFVLDSTTFMLDMIINDILSSQGTTSASEGITLPQWQTVTNRFSEVFRKIKSYQTHFVVIGHQQLVKDELSGEIRTLPIMVGQKFPLKAPLYFDEVYRVFVDQKEKADSIYKIQTSSCRKYSARSRMNRVDPETGKVTAILDQYEPADFGVIMDKIQIARSGNTEG